MMHSTHIFALGCAFALAPACLDVAKSRAEDDALVGHLQAGDMKVDVSDGLACVRSVGRDSIELRAQAPVFRFRATPNTQQNELHVFVRNALFDATLEAHDSSGKALAITAQPAGADPTDRHWSVSVPVEAVGALDFAVHAPDENDERPYRFAVLADVQEAIVSVRDIYARMREDKDLRFVVFSGDLTSRGSRAELLEFEDREGDLPIPLYATLGNHELGADRVYFQELFGRASTHFDFRGVAFSLIDSASATIDPIVYDWLSNWLAANRDRTHVVSMHIPPFDPVGMRNGAFGNRNEAAKTVALLADGRVDLALFGHIHSYYAFSVDGVPAYISGGGGAVPERMDGIGRHYLIVDVDPHTGIRSVAVTRVD